MDFGLLETLANIRGRKEGPHSKKSHSNQGQAVVKVGRWKGWVTGSLVWGVGLVLGCTHPSLYSPEGWWRWRKPDLSIDLCIVSLVQLWTTSRGGATLSGACRRVVASP